jgi:HK97 gp10 family phage protein
MRELSMLDMVTRLAAAEVAVHVGAHAALERVATRVEQTAKAELGVYQPATGPFPEWAELADSTKADRVAKGFTENDPLLRTGALRDSISHEVEGLTATIGSTSDIAEYQEFGTSKMPPRPFLGPALERNHEAMLAELGGAVTRAVVGKDAVHPSLGYDNTLTP